VRYGKIRPLKKIGTVEPVDLLIWDIAGEEKIRAAVGGSMHIVSLDVVAYRYISPLYLPLAFFYILNALILRDDEGATFLRRECRTTNGFFRVLGQVFNLSAVLAFRPRMLVSYTDDSITTQRIDAILYRHMHVITLQNGRRWHSPALKEYPEYKISYIAPGFHSCFAALSNQEIDHHRAAGWIIKEGHDVGALNAAFAFDPDEKFDKKYDICIIENSPIGLDRKSNKIMVSLVNSYVRNKKLKVCVALKRNKKDKNFPEYYRAVRSMYDESIELLPRSERGSSITVTMSSRLTIGILTTLLIETFGLGNRIYPLNFEHEAFDVGYSCLGMEMRPNQKQFESIVDQLLSLEDQEYFARYKVQMAYIGALSDEKRPLERLRTLIVEKMESSPYG
jgi:hypothetical protein